jgi:ethanolamine utilization microcompartment shell protein EutS
MTEPTYSANFLLEIPLNQRATYTWIANPGRELRTTVGTANGIGLRSVSSGGTANQNATIAWDE